VSARRLRLALVALALALFVPAALLVDRALRGAEAEQAMRHQVVAERVFDEMERALSDLVEREEARPVEAFRAGGMPRLPDEPYVLAYFQIEADGRVTSPVPARDDAALDAVAAAFATPVLRDEAAKRAPEQKPGTTVAIAKMEKSQLRALGYVEKDADSLAESAPPAEAKNAYDALQSLNRGAEERADRQRKVFAPSSPADGASSAAGRGIASLEAEAPAAGAPPRSQPTRVAVDPLVGRLADARHLLLYRSVFTGGEALRQGLVIDVDALGATLRERALGATRVGAELAFGASDAASRPGPWTYRHRFAEPFDAVGATLALAPLGGSDGTPLVLGLAALFAVTALAGLYAVHRMVTTAMAFAERRSNFVAAVTHELKTPLTAIRMYGEMLRDDLVASEAKRREYYGTITAESERLGRLIDNVLEFSRLEKGTREMRLAVGPVGPVIEDVASLLRPHAEREGFALRVEIEPDLPPVRYERDALLQVLVNLVDNAIKYAKHATPREIAIACRRSDAGGVVVSVRDRGPGVAGRHLARIFEPFHRGEDELTRTTQGTGLGLALVKSLVERMDGAVRGANRADGGFEVSVALPRAS